MRGNEAIVRERERVMTGFPHHDHPRNTQIVLGKGGGGVWGLRDACVVRMGKNEGKPNQG